MVDFMRNWYRIVTLSILRRTMHIRDLTVAMLECMGERAVVGCEGVN